MNDDTGFGEPGLTFVTEDADLLEESPGLELHGVEVHPAQHGYTVVYNYALYFWRPYLGNTAFALWELLLSFCYGDCDTAYPSVSRLARMITNSDCSRGVVSGRRRKAAAHSGAPVKRRHAGALAVLRRNRLVQVMRRGQGPTVRYTFRVLKSLPLLRPDQVARLSPSLQRDHARWLERYGIDPQTYVQAFRCEPTPSSSNPPVPGEKQAATASTGRSGPLPTHPSPASAGTGPDATRHASAARHTPVDPDLTPAGSDSSGGAPGDTGRAPSGTNNPQEKDLSNKWWQETLGELRLQMPRSAFDTCLLGTEVQSFQDGVLTIRARGELARQVLEHRLHTVIYRTLVAVCDFQVKQVRFVAAPPDER
jgi:hypothetical protein